MTRMKFEGSTRSAANDGSASEFRAQVRIAAPTHRAWQQLSEVTRWPSWLPTVDAVVPLPTRPQEPSK